jgi:hypothetical protein
MISFHLLYSRAHFCFTYILYILLKLIVIMQSCLQTEWNKSAILYSWNWIKKNSKNQNHHKYFDKPHTTYEHFIVFLFKSFGISRIDNFTAKKKTDWFFGVAINSNKTERVMILISCWKQINCVGYCFDLDQYSLDLCRLISTINLTFF